MSRCTERNDRRLRQRVTATSVRLTLPGVSGCGREARRCGTPPQLITSYRQLVEAGMRYFIVSCGSDLETLRILAQEVMPQVAVRWFREAMTAPMIDALASMINAQLEVVSQGHTTRTAELTGEIDRLEGQASHLVRFLATGGDSAAVRGRAADNRDDA